MRILLLICLTLVLTGCPSRPRPRPEHQAPLHQAAQEPLPLPSLPPPSEPQSVPAAPTPRAAFTSFLTALEDGNAVQAWALVSARARHTWQVTPEQFAAGIFLEMRLAYLGWQQYGFALDQQVTEQLAVIAVMGDRVSNGETFRETVLAVPVVHEADGWRLFVGAGPTVSAGAPSATTMLDPRQTQVAFYGASPANVDLVRLWLDGTDITPDPNPPAARELMVSTRLREPFSPGIHVVVALAVDTAGNPTTLGWSFRVGQ